MDLKIGKFENLEMECEAAIFMEITNFKNKSESGVFSGSGRIFLIEKSPGLDVLGGQKCGFFGGANIF